MLPAVLDGAVFEWSLGAFLPGGIKFVLRADALGMLFAFLASGLWIVTSFYSIGYMRGNDEVNQTRYFAAFAVSLSATMGIAFAGNLVTIFVFYELLSIATYPLVAHDETDEARAAGRKYLAYTMFGGGVLVLAGTALVYLIAGNVSFTAGGIEELAADPGLAMLAFFLLAIGFGVKAGMPLHQWLPEAMVAPTPVSGCSTRSRSSSPAHSASRGSSSTCSGRNSSSTSRSPSASRPGSSSRLSGRSR